MSKKKLFSQILNKCGSYCKNPENYFNIYNNIKVPTTFKYREKLSKTIKIKQATDNFLFSPDKTSHIDLTEDNNVKYNIKGQFVVRDKNLGQTILRQATDSEVLKSNSLAIGGIYSDTPLNISALIKYAHQLASNSNKIKFQPVSLFPEVTRIERYKAAEKYSKDSSYYPPYIKDRVNKYIMPKITDEDTLFDIPMTFSLFAFSVGGREIMMMENALKDILLKDYKLSENLVVNVFANFRVLCLGYAFDPSHTKKIGFPKVFVFSEDDRGVLSPKPLETQILGKEKSDPNQKFSVVQLVKNQPIHPAYMITIAHNAVPLKIVSNQTDDHLLAHYLDGISIFSNELKEMIGNCLTYNDE